MFSVFGPQHGGHLLEVGDVALVLHAEGETEGDDPFCDVDQVHLIVLLHGQNHTLASGRTHRTAFWLFARVAFDLLNFIFTSSLVMGQYWTLGFIKNCQTFQTPYQANEFDIVKTQPVIWT